MWKAKVSHVFYPCETTNRVVNCYLILILLELVDR
jgi:hypothetical protein